MENDNSHTINVVAAADDAEKASKSNETDARFPENRRSGVFSETGSGSERGEKGEESAVEVAVDESGSNAVAAEIPLRSSSGRVPFTNLSQVDSDLALARTLQEQERAYMMLSMNGEISEYGRWEAGSFVYEDDDDDDDEEEEYETDVDPQEDATDVNAHEEDGNVEEVSYSDDEAYARALQEAEEREMAARLYALRGLADGVEDLVDDGHASQDAWNEMDPDELSYEELLALGEIAGTQSKGLSADTIASLPSKRYKDGDNKNGTSESCVICRLDYEDDDDLILLPCKHSYHSECIHNWLEINKMCPVCSAEVSTSSSGQS
ncbi:unnamed protein product [Cochlearia groenlandica]